MSFQQPATAGTASASTLTRANADLARERVGMFLDIEYPETAA